ncbi:hypothetical protein SASPL_103487 [Salvia splendens]|uniref:Uncharacterized protein n=1 Tax=Salvia splendens TaxID=180675 RepID=A0A8X8YL16_SALSN|nr:hypothetical protein SASPL_103487 [Salvia splendens]
MASRAEDPSQNSSGLLTTPSFLLETVLLFFYKSAAANRYRRLFHLIDSSHNLQAKIESDLCTSKVYGTGAETLVPKNVHSFDLAVILLVIFQLQLAAYNLVRIVHLSFLDFKVWVIRVDLELGH